MEVLSLSVTFPKSQTFLSLKQPITTTLPNKNNHSSSSISCNSSFTRISATNSQPSISQTDMLLPTGNSNHWIVRMDKPAVGVVTKAQIVDHYAQILSKVIGNEKDAQKCLYHVSWKTNFGFCCEIDEDRAHELAGVPGVLSVQPDHNFESENKNYEDSNHWIVRMDKPSVGVVTKAQIVDHYAQILTKVIGNEKDAQRCLYHVSWKTNFGFCCEIDEDCAHELAGVPGVLSVQPDHNFESENKNYEGRNLENRLNVPSSLGETQETSVETKKLFVTGLSFYTSEKTLRTAFEGFGELVEVKVIIDKISKRSKGYAFIEYATEEAAGAALKEMNGKIINGWMIVVDVAKTTPPRYNKGRARPSA
ncbi:unnamed protein product [Lathyrus sativus]|nr:unnamed protein product [Lathyrus sativus]